MTERKIKLLIIEDSEDDTLLEVRSLKKEGFSVEYQRVQTADELKKCLTDNTWDVILSDYNMPGFTGLEAFEIFQSCHLDIPFIMISGKIGEEAAVEAMRRGINDYVMKEHLGRLGPAIERELRDAENKFSRERAEKELLQERQRFESIVRLSPLAIAIVKNEGTITFLNPTAIEMFGYTMQELPTMEDFIKRLYPAPRECKWVLSYYRNEFDPNISIPELTFPPVICKDGSRKYIKIRSGPLDEESFFLKIEDITIEKLATQALEENQKRLSQIIQTINDSIIEIRPDEKDEFTIISANMAFFKNTGLNFDQVYGAQVSAVFSSSENFMNNLHNAVYQRQSLHWEEEVYFPKGRRIWEIYLSPIFNKEKKLFRIVCSANDITERKNAEDRLRESENKFRTIASFVSDAIWEWDIKDDKVWWNEGLKLLFGYDSSNIKDNFDWLIRKVHPREQDRIRDEINKIFNKGEVGWAQDFRFLCADGSYKNVHNKTAILYDKEGEPVRLIGAMIDETSRKRREELRLQSLIEGADNERNAIARELHDSLGQILTLSHIKIKSILEDTDNQPMNQQIGQVEDLIGQSIQMTRNLSHNLIPKALHDYGLMPSLRNLVDMISRNSELDIDIFCNFEDEQRFNPKIEVNLYRIIQESLSNTVKHAKATKVTLQLMKQDKLLSVMIEDNGKGFDVKHTAEKPGMGLENIRNRMLYIDGTVDVESRPGRGTLINLEVPLG